jgi:hypothetical protein
MSNLDADSSVMIALDPLRGDLKTHSMPSSKVMKIAQCALPALGLVDALTVHDWPRRFVAREIRASILNLAYAKTLRRMVVVDITALVRSVVVC